MPKANLEMGAVLSHGDQCRFAVWGPELNSVELHLVSPDESKHSMQKSETGVWTAILAGVKSGTRYLYCLNGAEMRPDPGSHYQPEGVHGPSEVVDHRAYTWQDTAWKNLPLEDYVIYELHVGTFTPAGTFEAAIAQLQDLKDLGVTAIEIMPVAQFPGARNWGYDGAYPYAVQNSYGGPEGLRKLVDACHQIGLAVVLDVVFNHFGPEGNYAECYGPFTTEKYSTPWGGAINFDEAWCDGVRRFFVENAVYWLREYHIDALRLDAVQAIYDLGAKHFLAAVAEAVAALSEETGRTYYLTAESDLNDVRLITPINRGGYGLDAQWSDDIHHALHVLLAGEKRSYYQDFQDFESLARGLRDRFIYSGKFSPFRRRTHGNDATQFPSHQFIVCSQNHDQVGHHIFGERLWQLTSLEAAKLAAGTLLTSPYIPLLFMGEEYAEDAPFVYFVDHSDPELIKAVDEGRKAEFKDFYADAEPWLAHEKETFDRCKLNWNLRHEGFHKTLWHYYQRLLQLRRALKLNASSLAADIQIGSDATKRILYYQREMPEGQLLVLMNFNDQSSELEVAPPTQTWHLKIDSASQDWAGPGSVLPEKIAETQMLELAPLSFALYWVA